MALSKLPDSTSEELRCSCGLYLSSAPVFVCQDGQSVCGKCKNVQTSNLGTISQNFAYEALAKLFKFPCCYKSKGCSQYVEFNKAAEHEDDCLYCIYECPLNTVLSCNKRGTTTELCRHYAHDHPAFYLKDSTFTVNVAADFEFYHLHKIHEDVVLLHTKCSTSAGKLWFKTIYFGNTINASLVHYNIKLSSTDGKKRVMELEQEKACSINSILLLPSQYVEVDISVAASFLNNSEFQCHWVINSEQLNDRIKKQQEFEEKEIFETKKERIRCPFCSNLMVAPIYRCDQNHVTCLDCRGYDNQCRSCLKSGVTFTIAADLEAISKFGNQHCKWRNCDQELSYDVVRPHERECFYRVYECPECNWSGIYDMFLNHCKSVHRNLDIHLTNVVALNLNLKNYSSYIIVHREMFKFVVNHQHTFGVNNFVYGINIYFLGSPTYVNDWKYEVKDKFGNVYSCRRDQYIGAITIFDGPVNLAETNNWTFGNLSLANKKCYSLYITKCN